MTTGTVRYRDAVLGDVAAMFEIRTSVRENAMTLEQLHVLGIDEEVVAAIITTHGSGWIAEDGDLAVGFCIADRRDGSIFALYVRPDFEGQGYGRTLLQAGVSHLHACGCDRLWLAVGRNTRAHGFYLKLGWIETGTVENGDVKMEKQSR